MGSAPTELATLALRSRLPRDGVVWAVWVGDRRASFGLRALHLNDHRQVPPMSFDVQAGLYC